MLKFLHASHGSVSLQRSNGHAGCACEHCVHVRKAETKQQIYTSSAPSPDPISILPTAWQLAAGGDWKWKD
jgi:hypothetical protein